MRLGAKPGASSEQRLLLVVRFDRLLDHLVYEREQRGCPLVAHHASSTGNSAKTSQPSGATGAW